MITRMRMFYFLILNTTYTIDREHFSSDSGDIDMGVSIFRPMHCSKSPKILQWLTEYLIPLFYYYEKRNGHKKDDDMQKCYY